MNAYIINSESCHKNRDYSEWCCYKCKFAFVGTLFIRKRFYHKTVYCDTISCHTTTTTQVYMYEFLYIIKFNYTIIYFVCVCFTCTITCEIQLKKNVCHMLKMKKAYSETEFQQFSGFYILCHSMSKLLVSLHFSLCFTLSV